MTFLLIKYRTTLAGGVEPFVREVDVDPAAGRSSSLGVVLAQIYRSRDRARYDGIGRYLHEDVAP